MANRGEAKIQRIATGIPGLDDILGGGFPDSASKEPAIIAIDSYRALRDLFASPEAARAIVCDLLVNLSVTGVTTFLTVEYDPYEISHLPEFYSADSIFNLSLNREGLRASRRLEVLKLRGSNSATGVHFFDITSGGIVVFPRVSVPAELEKEPQSGVVSRLSTGVAGLDSMMGGGLPSRSTTLLQGGTGTGKSTLAISFLAEGARRGEPGLMITLEETREQVVESFSSRNWPLEQWDRQGLLRIVYVSPVELAGDALLQTARGLIDQLGAKRAVIDSISSLNLSLATENRSAELIYSLVKTFRTKDVTTIVTNEVPQLMGTAALSSEGYSFVVDNTIMLRYVEIESRLALAVTVLKMRGSAHERLLRELRITGDTVSVLDPFLEFHGVLSGVPTQLESGSKRRQGRGASARRTEPNK